MTTSAGHIREYVEALYVNIDAYIYPMYDNDIGIPLDVTFHVDINSFYM
jgi:hypothetical protein